MKSNFQVVRVVQLGRNVSKNFNSSYSVVSSSAELLSSWESLAKWSETAAEAKQLQDEMHTLKLVIKGYGCHSVLLESKEAIEITIQEFQVREIVENKS